MHINGCLKRSRYMCIAFSKAEEREAYYDLYTICSYEFKLFKTIGYSHVPITACTRIYLYTRLLYSVQAKPKCWGEEKQKIKRIQRKVVFSVPRIWFFEYSDLNIRKGWGEGGLSLSEFAAWRVKSFKKRTSSRVGGPNIFFPNISGWS